MAMISGKKNEILKFIIIFVMYLCYTQVFNFVFDLIGVKGVISSFLADLVFLLGIVYVYKNDLKESWNEFCHKIRPAKKIKIILLGFLGMVLITMLYGMITSILFPNQDMTDDNTNALYNLPIWYATFKVTIFAVVAEILVFIKTPRNILDNNSLYIVVSGLIYALMNIAYSSLDFVALADFLRCFVVGAFLALIFVRTNNVIAVMFTKFAYTLVPLTIMLVERGVM